MPVAPAWIASSPETQAEWDRVTALLTSTGVIARADADILTAYVETVLLFKRASQICRDQGLTFVTDEGFVKRHPAVGIAADSRKDLLRLASELGMTPVSRQRLKIEAEQHDSLGDFLRSKA